MNEFRGIMRRTQESCLNTPSKEMFESDFHQEQRQKYERSQHSYIQGNGNTRSVHNLDRSVLMKDSKEIFDNNIPIKVKSFERDDFNTLLRVQIFVLQEKSGNLLKLNLTDDSNHLFLWSFYLKESDYMSLRNEQKIKVDFGGFPEMLVQHFGFLENEKEVQSNQTFFHSVFDIRKGGQATLNILESNKFKQSLHLSLRFRMATDEQIKGYLSEKLSREKQYNEQLRINNSKLQDVLNSRMIELESLSVKHRQLSQDRNKEMESLTIAEQRKLNQHMERSLAKQSQLTKDHESQKKKIVEKYEKNIKELNDKLLVLQQTNEQLTQKCLQLQSRQRELTSKSTIYEKELAMNTKQLDEVRKYSKQLEAARFSQQKLNTQLTCKVDSLSRQLHDKIAIIESNKELKDTANSQVQVLEQQVQEHKRKSEKLQIKLEQASQDLTRASLMIDQLKEKNQKKKDKIDQMKQILKSQDAAYRDKEKQLHQSNRQKDSLRKQNEDLKIKNADLELKKKQSAKHIQDNNALITHLNRQLTERAPGYRPAYTPQPSAVTRYPLNVPMAETQTSYQTGTSRLRGSTSPLERSDRIQPQINRYIPMDIQLPLPTALLNQQRDPEETVPTMPTEPSSKIRPVRYKNPE